jgi:hypothetical protein
MLDSEATTGFRPWFGSGLVRRLVVIAICAGVTLATTLAVHRSAGRGSTSVAPVASPVLRSGSRLPPEASKSPVDRGEAAAQGTAAGMVPAHPADVIGGLMNARAAALRDGDRAAWLGTVAPASDPRVTRFREAQRTLFDRVRTLRPASWGYRVVGGHPLPANRRQELGNSPWLAQVRLSYQLTAGGPRVERQQFLTIVRRSGGWLIADDTDGSTGRDVWDLGPIAHAVAERCVVVGARSRQAQIRQLAAECGRSAAAVDAAWGRAWPRRTVLTVPGSVQQLAVLLGRTGSVAGRVGVPGKPGVGTGGTAGQGVGTGASRGPGVSVAGADSEGGGPGAPRVDGEGTEGLEQTAAVTIGPADAPADGVLINGAAFDQLSPVGRRVVLTHELVHVATRATGSWSAPTWLAEGYADHVAYTGTGLSSQQVAGEALDGVRAGRMPDTLPSAEDFNAAGDEAVLAYGQAWIAAGVIADRAGSTARMKSFYQQAAAGTGPAGLDAALNQIGLGGTEIFVPLWQTRLAQLAQ